MTASQNASARAHFFPNGLRHLFARVKQGKKISRKDLFTDTAMAGAGMRSYMVMPGQPVWSDRNYYQFSLEAYIKNVIAHRAMAMVSGAAASVRLKLYQCTENGRSEIISHPILDILKKPNPTHATSEFFQALHQYKLISGNAFIQAVGPSGTPPRELHLLRPDRMAVIAGTGTMPGGYRYTVNGDYIDFPVDRITGMSRILHLKNFHPLNDWYGLSPVEAAAYSIDQHNQAGAWNQALLQNGARPSGALVVRADSTGGGTLSEEQYNRVKLQIDDQFTGAINAGRPLLLEGGLDWKEMSISPKDMDFVQAKNSSARDIALAFGVPPQMLGIPGDNTYSNLQEARLALWEQTVIPLVKTTTDALNGWLAPMFGGGLELCPDTDNISILATKNQTLWSMVDAANFLNINEKRAAVGYGPLPEAKAKKKVEIRREVNGRRRVVKDWGDEFDRPDDISPEGQIPDYEDMEPPDSWGSNDLGKFEDHYEDHGNNFNATSPENYADQANQFYDRIADEGLPAVEGPDDVVRAYDPDTNTFGAYNSDGTTRTFFQPDDGEPYFRDQVDRDLSNGGGMINPFYDGLSPENSPLSGTAAPEPLFDNGGRGGSLPGIDPIERELED